VIKNNYKKASVFFLIGAIVFLLFSVLDVKVSFKNHFSFSKKACAASDGVRVYVNDLETDLVCEENNGTYLVPVELPFKEGKNNWEVIITFSEEEKKVEVLKKFHPIEELLPTRGDDEEYICNQCDGSGDCSTCWPEGSGYSDGADSLPCDFCSGNGKCWYCSGSGKW